mgnify:CR=1 FL=1
MGVATGDAVERLIVLGQSLGRVHDAAQARAMGFVHEVCASEALDAKVDELVATMVARKAELYPEEKMLVTNFILKFNHKQGAQFRVSAVNINPEGIKKADLPDMVKVTA